MSTIEINSNKANRKISVAKPNVLGLTTLSELVEEIGEEICVNQITQKNKDAFRALIRTKLEKTDDEGDFVFDDEAILNEDYSDWKPSMRVTKTAEEKALEAFSSLTPEAKKALLESLT
ncbi:MAG TPA: hypothetical protein VJ878_04735 [Candidatus Izemoplasmatales bacterium]|nr:hypothetical protein [Candidatus Izemoplasmatales bacterium]